MSSGVVTNGIPTSLSPSYQELLSHYPLSCLNPLPAGTGLSLHTPPLRIHVKYTLHSSLVPSLLCRKKKRALVQTVLHMDQVALVTCILLRYTKITDNYSLPARRPCRRNMIPTNHIQVVLKPKMILLQQ